LGSLLCQAIPGDVQPVIVVVENGETARCRDYVDEVAHQAPEYWTIIYVLETELGIPQARNRSIDVALAQKPDWIGFIDDDETVDKNWLERMVAAMRELPADVLQGPVRYIYPDDKPQWLDEKASKSKPRGTVLRTAYTNNTFMRSHVARRDGLGLRFDEAMRFTGGSDSDFFFRAFDRGAIIKWVDDAWVQEVVPPSRLTVRWQLTRALRVAANASVIHRKRLGLAAACLRYLPKSMTRLTRGALLVCIGAPLWLVGLLRGRTLLYMGRKDIASGLGGVLGLVGFAPQPYRTVDRSGHGTDTSAER
jgi:succinoglycan biosynthesis protein ExoM